MTVFHEPPRKRKTVRPVCKMLKHSKKIIDDYDIFDYRNLTGEVKSMVQVHYYCSRCHYQVKFAVVSYEAFKRWRTRVP